VRKSKVGIILSTYNGEKYLKDLLESLVKQDYDDIVILIRDDGSSDNTVNLIKEYILKHKNISFLSGKNIGVIRSFFELLKYSSDADFFAFSDQDDIWQENKVSHAVSFLEKFPQEVPLMYCSRVLITDEQLNVLGVSRTPRKEPSFENALVENIATGCTIVINKVAKDLILSGNSDLRKIRMHDWWIYLVVSAFGKVLYDKTPSIFYRQHTSNVVGVKVGLLAKWKDRIQRFRRYGHLHLLTEQVREFHRIYGYLLPEHKRKILERFLESRESFMGRLGYAFTCEIYRQSWIDNFILKILILLNRI
jgi:glycosyltransferase involved in cell wall biosynthesis